MFSQKASTNGLKNSVECNGKGHRKREVGHTTTLWFSWSAGGFYFDKDVYVCLWVVDVCMWRGVKQKH